MGAALGVSGIDRQPEGNCASARQAAAPYRRCHGLNAHGQAQTAAPLTELAVDVGRHEAMALVCREGCADELAGGNEGEIRETTRGPTLAGAAIHVTQQAHPNSTGQPTDLAGMQTGA